MGCDTVSLDVTLCH